MSKRIYLNMENGEVYSVLYSEPLEARARYYADKDEDTTYEQEVNDFQDEHYEVYDWLTNNMEWYECKSMRKEEPPNLDYSDLEIEDYEVKNEII